jgi:hypothetical protein
VATRRIGWIDGIGFLQTLFVAVDTRFVMRLWRPEVTVPVDTAGLTCAEWGRSPEKGDDRGGAMPPRPDRFEAIESERRGATNPLAGCGDDQADDRCDR